MPPKRTSEGGAARRGRPAGSKNKAKAPSKPANEEPESSNPFASSDNDEEVEEVGLGVEERPRATVRGARDAEEEEQQPEKTIPRDLLTRLLHEFFAKDATRISKDANAAVGKYVDVFVREALVRAAVEKRGGFLEVSHVRCAVWMVY